MLAGMGVRRQIALVADYSDLVRCLRARREELNISLAELDAVCGFASGTAAKYLSELPDNAMTWGKQRNNWRSLGPKSFGAILFALGLALSVVEDEAALRQAGEMTRRKRNQVRHRAGKHDGKHVSVSLELLRSIASKGGGERAKRLSGRRRTQIARKAAQARWAALSATGAHRPVNGSISSPSG
jgi:hypothetical protein